MCVWKNSEQPLNGDTFFRWHNHIITSDLFESLMRQCWCTHRRWLQSFLEQTVSIGGVELSVFTVSRVSIHLRFTHLPRHRATTEQRHIGNNQSNRLLPLTQTVRSVCVCVWVNHRLGIFFSVSVRQRTQKKNSRQIVICSVYLAQSQRKKKKKLREEEEERRRRKKNIEE